MGVVIIIAIIILIVVVSRNKQDPVVTTTTETAATTKVTTANPSDSLISYYEKVRKAMVYEELEMELINIGKLAFTQNGERKICDSLAVWFFCRNTSRYESTIATAQAMGMEIIEGDRDAYTGHYCVYTISDILSPVAEQTIIKETLDKLTDSCVADEIRPDSSGNVIYIIVHKR